MISMNHEANLKVQIFVLSWLDPTCKLTFFLVATIFATAKILGRNPTCNSYA
jgi:hypothetical protein